MAMSELARIPSKKTIPSGEHTPSPINEMGKAQKELREAEASVLSADTWLKQVANKIAEGNFSTEDAEYLRDLLGSEQFEEGSVQFLSSITQALEQALTLEIEPAKRHAAEIRLAAAKKHLEALGKRLAGLRLLLNGPKPLHVTPPPSLDYTN